MNEARILDKLRSRVRSVPSSWITKGIGDDCAVLRQPGAKEDLVFTTDMLIEDVHFLRTTHPPEAIGHTALARGLSDIAAMGATPRFCLLSLALPGWADEAWLDRFWSGFLKLARRAKVELAGGDLAKAASLTCDIVVCGSVARGKALLRSGARAGELVYVSGLLGGAEARRQAGLVRLPKPRLVLGRGLLRRATACMDLSDGLSLDLHRLCLASGVAAVVDHVPAAKGATEQQALHGGEDYELLFTLPRRAKPPKGCHSIGVIAEAPAGAVWYRGARLEPKGWDHFGRG